MINVSANASAAINSDSRRFRARFLLDGNVIDGSIKHITVNKGSCGDAEFVPGALYSSFIDAVVDYCPIALEKKELKLQFGVLVGDDYEWSDIGYFTVVNPATSAYTTSFSAIGRLSSHAGKLYVSELSYPATIQAVLNEISEQIGVTIDASEFNTSGVINTKPSGYMHREVLAYIAGLFFGYVTETADGQIRFGKFQTENIAETNGDRTTLLPTFADIDTEVTGISVTTSGSNEDGSATEEVFTSGVVSIALQNPFMTQALFDANVGNIIGFNYRSGSVPITMGDFRLEESDCMQVTDVAQNTYLVPCMHVQHVFDGGMTTYIIAPTFTSEDDTSQFKGALAQRVERYEADLVAAKQIIAQKVSADEVEAIVGNFDFLTADSADLKYATIENLNATNLSVSDLSAKAVTTDNLEAKVGEFGFLTADSAEIKALSAKDAEIESLFADYATVDSLAAATGRIDTLESTTIKTDELESKVGTFGYLKAETAAATYATITDLDATDANVQNLQASVAEIEKAYIDETEVNTLIANKGYLTEAEVDTLVAEKGYMTEAQVDTLVSDKGYITTLETENLLADYATVESLNATDASISDLAAKAITTDNLSSNVATLGYATVSQLEVEQGRIDTLETNSLTADSAVIKALEADVADIDTLIFGSASGTTIQTSFANAVIAQLGNAQIKSAMIESVSAGQISAGDIITNNVRVMSDDGKLLISDETIQISDATRVRVQIGKDSAGDYSINIWDADGNLMFSEGGITDKAIKEAIIRNDMVTDDANISASKLDIDSLFTEINNSSKTIKSTKIYLDDKKQTLDVAFTAVTSDVSELSNDVSSQGTAISAIQGQISSKVWQEDIDTATNELDGEISTLSTQYTDLNQTVNGLTATVASHTTEIANKADGSAVTAVSNRVTQVETNLDGFKSTVSETYTTKDKAVTETHRFFMLGSGGSDTLTWDGDTSGLTCVDGVMYKVSDVTPSLTDCSGGCVITFVTPDGKVSETVTSEDYGNGIIGIMEAVIVTPEGVGNNLGGGVFNEAGVYFISTDGFMISSLTINGYNGFGGAPSKPTTYPPDGSWQETEPQPDGTEGTLYYVDCDVYADGSFAYSDVSQSNGYSAHVNVSALGARVSVAETSIEQNAESIALKVSANGVISAINQTAETVKISASKIELTGAVTFSTFSSDLQSKINGIDSDASDALTKADAAKDAADSANSVIADWCYNNNKTYIDGANIYTGTIKAKQIDVNDLFAQDITATGTIRSSNMQIIGGYIQIEAAAKESSIIKISNGSTFTEVTASWFAVETSGADGTFDSALYAEGLACNAGNYSMWFGANEGYAVVAKNNSLGTELHIGCDSIEYWKADDTVSYIYYDDIASMAWVEEQIILAIYSSWEASY